MPKVIIIKAASARPACFMAFATRNMFLSVLGW